MKFRRLVRNTALLLVGALTLVSCTDKGKYHFEEGIAWNTVFHITYQSKTDLADSIHIILDEINNSLSPFIENSSLSKINDNRSDSIDKHFARVYKKSVNVNQATEGAFDPTLAPIIRAWGFGQGHKVTADTMRIDKLLSIVGISKTHLMGDRIIKENPKIEFNFSALAKGYGVDCIADMFERNGVTNFLVEIGGEIRLSGKNQSGRKWAVGIDSPEEDADADETVTNIYLSEGGIATSGNYRNYQKTDSKTFGHTISPLTGRPAETDILSATVVAPTCMEADALATSCMVLGSEKALELCTRLRVGVMLIKKDMSVVSNPAFRAFLEK